MSLLTRLSHTSENDEDHIGVQGFYAALIAFANGVPGITQAAIKSRWGVTDATDITQFNAIVASYTAAANKAVWMVNFHAVLLLAEESEFDMQTPATALAAMQAGE